MCRGRKARTAEQQIEPGKRQEEFPAAHQEAIDPTAVEAGESAAQQSQGEREKGGDQAGEQRNLPAVKHAREDVAAKTIAAPEEENTRRADAEEPAADKEANGIGESGLRGSRRQAILGDAVDEGARVEAAGGIGEVDAAGGANG
jgi:hypothetical protein